jgi:hypothetical protein
MAREMLETDYHSRKEKIKDVWHMESSRAMEEKLSLPAHPELPAFPSESEIIAKAKLLNAFVSNG